MKIAVLSDVHGNDIALKAVLAEAEAIGVDRLIVLGDFVGYYYHPDKVLSLLGRWPAEMIQGNHDRMLAKAGADENELSRLTEKYGSGLRFALEKLDSGQIDNLEKLPKTRQIEVAGLRILIAHGSPWDGDFYVYPDKISDVADRFDRVQADFIFLGHTHYPFSFSRSDHVIVNPGSVGQARDRGGMASWAVLDVENRAVVFKHTPYDIKTLIDEVKTIDPNLPFLHQVLMRNPSIGGP